jgi:hypothetical protein
MKQPFEFAGKIIAITKLKTDAMLVKISITGGVYVEVNCGKDEVLFNRLCKAFELDKDVKMKLETA